jgi:hypothetical protein
MLIGAISGHDKSKTLADMLLTVMFVQLKAGILYVIQLSDRVYNVTFLS